MIRPTAIRPRRTSRPVGALGAILVLLLTHATLTAEAQAPSGASGGIDHRAVLGEPNGGPRAGDALREETERVASLLRCVSCQGLSVAASPAPAAVAMKEEVRELLADGYDEEQILDYFEGGFGEFIRLAPKAEGFNLVVWLAPVGALIVGLMLIAMRLRSRQRAAEKAPDEGLDEYLEQVRREAGE